MLIMSSPEETRKAIRRGRSGVGGNDKELEKVRSVAAAAIALKTLAGDSSRSLTDKSEGEHSDAEYEQKKPSAAAESEPTTSAAGKTSRSTLITVGGKDKDDNEAAEGEQEDLGSSLMHMNFPRKLMEVLSDPELHDIVSWLPHGKSFFIMNPKKFSTQVLPRYFNKQAEYRSFTRRLLRWGFKRVSKGNETGAYYHKFFQRDKPHLCNQIVTGHKTSDEATKKAAPRSSTAKRGDRSSTSKYLDDSSLPAHLAKKQKRSLLPTAAQTGSSRLHRPDVSSAFYQERVPGASQQQLPQHLQHDTLLSAAAAAAAGIAEPWQIELLRISQRRQDTPDRPQESPPPASASASAPAPSSASASAATVEAALLHQQRLAALRAMGGGDTTSRLPFPLGVQSSTGTTSSPFGAIPLPRQLLSNYNPLSSQYGNLPLPQNQSMLPPYVPPSLTAARAQAEAAAQQYAASSAATGPLGAVGRGIPPSVPPSNVFDIVQAAREALERNNSALNRGASTSMARSRGSGDEEDEEERRIGSRRR